MLSAVPKATRNWVAGAFIALYALCVLAPVAALAFNAHCFIEDHGMGAVHIHSAKAVHEHHGDAADDRHHTADAKQGSPSDTGTANQDAADKCCAVTVFSAIAPDFGVTSAPANLSGAAIVVIHQAFSGIPPSKLIRPPKLLS
jgi:hypothetical protein